MKSFIMKSETVRKALHLFIDTIPLDGKFVAVIKLADRTVEQNAAQWPILTAFSKQLEWCVNGKMVKMSPDDWKDVLTSAFKKENARIAQGIDGGMVFLGQRTSKFNHEEFNDWIEFLNYIAQEKGVKVPISKKESEKYNGL